MAKKKEENILDYLSKGKEECFEHEYYGVAVKGRVCITTSTGVYEFPKTYLDKNYNQSDYKEILLKDWNNTKRAMHDLDSVRIVRCCTDKEDLKKFGEAMLYLRDHPQDAQIYAAIYEKSKLVPEDMRQYMYDEIRWWARVKSVQKDGGRSLNMPIPFEIAERMPKAFRKGCEEVTFTGFDFNKIVERLTPKYRIGEEVHTGHGEGKIIRICAILDKNSKYQIRYEVDYGSYWGRTKEEEKYISPVPAVAV